MHFAAVGAAMAMAMTLPSAYSQGRGRGMPAEAREAIHGLFDAHDKFQREVKKTEDGYVSKTTSKDPAAVKLLQKHVKQMEARLKKGFMVRRWDPAYEEFVNHYDDIEIKITKIDNGISVVASGKTEAAVKVARNHAGIVSKFIKNGWKEHDKEHPAVAANAQKPGGGGGKGKKACCLAGTESGEAKACCKKKAANADAEECGECAKKSAKGEGGGAKPCCKGKADATKAKD